jgi:RND family efflux transporter MFP subunit
MKKWILKVAVLIKWTAGLGCLVLIVAFLAGTFRSKIIPGELPEPPLDLKTPFTPGEVIRKEEPVLEKVPGSIAAKHQFTVSSRIMAGIEDVLARAGDFVAEGSPLVILDSRDLEARERQTEEELAAAKAQLEEAQRDFERVEDLYKENVVPLSKFDASQRAFRVATARVDNLKQALEEARIAHTYARILSPITGRVIDRLAEPGGTAVPGQPLLKVYDPSALRLEAYVRESLSSHLKRGDHLTVSVDALNQEVEARVEEVVPQAEPGARAFLVKVALPLDDRLYPGMFGRLVIRTGSRTVIYAPQSAVQTVGQLDLVVILKEGRPHHRQMVKPGERHDGSHVEVISGLEPGDNVAVFGQ